MRPMQTFNTLIDAGKMLYLLLLGILLFVIYCAYKRIKKIRIINKLPGPKSHFIFGNALELRGTEAETFKTLIGTFCDYGNSMIRVWFGSFPRCIIYKADVIEEFLKCKVKFTKGRIYKYAYPWLGNGILIATGTKWHQTRKLLTPAFHLQILEDFLEYFNEQSAIFVEKLDSKANGIPFDIHKPIALCALDSLLETVMGRNVNAQDNPNIAFVNATSKIQEILIKRAVTPWMFSDFMFKLLGYKKQQDEALKVLNGFTDETIRMRRDTMGLMGKPRITKGGRKRLSFLDLLLENQDTQAIPSIKIHEEVNTLMFGGHDTTSTAVFWTIYALGVYTETQEKLIEEIDSVFGGSERPITTEHLREMKYLDCCLKESMRIFPPIPTISRIFHEDITLGGFEIPAGTNVTVMIYRLHRDPEQFPEPEVFKPERFFPENSVNRHCYAYIPFSAGARNCIGQKFAVMEAKVMICSLLRRYRVESAVKIKDLKLKRGLVLGSEDKDLVKLFRRK